MVCSFSLQLQLFEKYSSNGIKHILADIMQYEVLKLDKSLPALGLSHTSFILSSVDSAEWLKEKIRYQCLG